MGNYGTNLEGFGGFEGGVNADNGATLVSTDSEGENSQLFGPAALREIQAGVANGDFEILPVDAASAISDENPLPYFSFTDNSSGRIVASVADSTLATGQTVLRFTLTNAINADEVYFTRYVPVPTSEARTYGNQPRVAIAAATSSANYRITWSAQYVKADQVTTTGAAASRSATGAEMNTAISGSYSGNLGAEYSNRPNGTGCAPVDAAYLLIKLSVNATGSVASATLDIAEIRIDRSQVQYLLTDQSKSDLYGPGRMYLYEGAVILESDGVVGSKPQIFLSAQTGSIFIDAREVGKTISLTSASRTGSTVTIVTTIANEFEAGSEIVVAGITGAAGTSMNGTFIVASITNATTFTYTAAGTAGSGTVTSATVRTNPGFGSIYLKPAATASGKVRVEGRMDVDSMFTAANIASGVVTVDPVTANVVSSVNVTGLSVKTSAGTATQSDVSILVTAISAAAALRSCTASAPTFSGSNLTGFTVNIFRTNTTATGVWWYATGR